jgi:spore coat polysaccharide biosynthesis protein SpsF
VENIFPTPAEEISIRQATPKDAALYFTWVNDQVVRSASLNSSEIKWDEHLAWFNHKVDSDTSKMYVCHAGGLPVGQVRFDFTDKHVELDYSLDSEVRGRDWARVILDLALNEFRAHSQEAVFATVRNENIRSISALLKAGYAQISGDESSAVFLHT